MISITHPAVMTYVHQLPIGLLPIIFKGDPVPRLIVKASKELILSAKVRKEFVVHIIPYEVAGVKSVGFLAAFPDDHEHPLILAGAFIEELMGHEMAFVLMSSEVNVHFFDELGREVLGYKARFRSSDTHRKIFKESKIPSIVGLNQSAILEYLSDWFRVSGARQDVEAIKVELLEALFPEEFVFADMRDESHQYHGSPNVSHYTLEREEPGAFQEKEIISLLERTFQSNCIYLSPKRVYDREEVADILVVTEKNIIIVQAKDSPNLERTINLPISRKRATAIKALRKAAAQVRGAANYLRRKNPAVILINDTENKISLEGKGMYGLVVMKELFDDDYNEYTPVMLNLYEQVQVPTIPLAYSELHQYTRFLHGDEAFLEALMKVFDWGSKTGTFPRLRVMAPGSVVNEPPTLP
ncbi:hypothetical protein [Pseudomonas hunanensis]|uniref:hypothetical protein n=1 Tax=Pseudomonas hunanensis TaxID=1247546 RepID=UPI0011AF0B3C|nr:hypothetical protein [Pseudomonas hunanensis]